MPRGAPKMNPKKMTAKEAKRHAESEAELNQIMFEMMTNPKQGKIHSPSQTIHEIAALQRRTLTKDNFDL